MPQVHGAQPLRYFVATLRERNGEYEYKHTVRFSLPARRKPSNFLEDLASQWYGAKVRREDGEYSFNCGEVAVSAGTFTEVDHSAFEALRDVITDMSTRN